MSGQLVSGLVLWSISLSVGQQLGCLICFFGHFLDFAGQLADYCFFWSPDFGIGVALGPLFGAGQWQQPPFLHLAH